MAISVFSMFKQLVKKTPIVRSVARKIMKLTATSRQKNFVSADYWEQRYRKDNTSGAGSYSRLARFKAETLNHFVTTHHIESVIEFGSGDGAQLWLANYPTYIGVDVSPTVLDLTRRAFAGDATKRFIHFDQLQSAD